MAPLLISLTVWKYLVRMSSLPNPRSHSCNSCGRRCRTSRSSSSLSLPSSHSGSPFTIRQRLTTMVAIFIFFFRIFVLHLYADVQVLFYLFFPWCGEELKRLCLMAQKKKYTVKSCYFTDQKKSANTPPPKKTKKTLGIKQIPYLDMLIRSQLGI